MKRVKAICNWVLTTGGGAWIALGVLWFIREIDQPTFSSGTLILLGVFFAASIVKFTIEQIELKRVKQGDEA